MKHKTMVLQTIGVLVVLSFVPECNGGLLDFLPFGSFFERDAKSRQSVIAYEKDIQGQIDKFRDVLVDPKCPTILESIPEQVDNKDWCASGNAYAFKVNPYTNNFYCDQDYIFKECKKSCCHHPSYVNSTAKGCIRPRPCNGHSYCDKTTNPAKPQCEENSFTAVNLRPVITEMEMKALLSLPLE